MAMRTGKTRSSEEISRLCRDSGFVQVKTPAAHRPYVTSVVTCVKPS
jgi:demethylspheroidene O-methyltransferase